MVVRLSSRAPRFARVAYFTGRKNWCRVGDSLLSGASLIGNGKRNGNYTFNYLFQLNTKDKSSSIFYFIFFTYLKIHFRKTMKLDNS